MLYVQFYLQILIKNTKFICEQNYCSYKKDTTQNSQIFVTIIIN